MSPRSFRLGATCAAEQLNCSTAWRLIGNHFKKPSPLSDHLNLVNYPQIMQTDSAKRGFSVYCMAVAVNPEKQPKTIRLKRLIYT